MPTHIQRRGRASNPVGDGIRSRAGSTPAVFRQSPKSKDRSLRQLLHRFVGAAEGCDLLIFGDTRRLEITLRFHPVMQDSDYRDPIGGDSKINHVTLHAAASVTGADRVACGCCFGTISQLLERRSQDVDVAIGLIQTPLLSCIGPDSLKIRFGGGGKSVFSHAPSTFFF
jgi:hypothetical protein